MTSSEAIELTGGLSQTSKLPGPSWSISAFDCITGSKLAKIPGSVCSKCYARRFRYNFPSVKNALKNRMRLVRGKLWARGIMTLILESRTKFFRWFDSGDLQGEWMVDKIVTVCEALPGVNFWLPTKEYALVKNRTFPKNVVVRVSAHMVDKMPPKFKGLHGSMVFTDRVPAGVHECKARFQGNQCGDCRACWDPSVAVVGYPEH